MTIAQDELQKMAKKLSKIPGENPKLFKNVSDILGYMDLLSEVKTDGVTPTVSVVDNNAHLREDKRVDPISTPSELLAQSEQKVVSWQIVLPNIMK